MVTVFRSSAVSVVSREQMAQIETYCDFGAVVGVVVVVVVAVAAAAAAMTVRKIGSKWARLRDCTQAISAMPSPPPPPALASATCFSHRG